MTQEQKVSPEETIETLQQLLNIKNNRITELEFGIITEQRNSIKLKERIEELEKAQSNGTGEITELEAVVSGKS
jgi:hypothetical protein